MSKETNILYLDCSNGISGDMFAGALVDLGADQETLLKTLETLPLDGYSVRISRVNRSALNVCDFDVILESEENGLDHDMDYLYGHEHSEEEYIHDHKDHVNPDHHHDPDGHVHPDHHHGHGGHVHRSLSDIRTILEGGSLSPKALETALSIFRIVAEAEGAVHGKPLEEVHFHEVGAVDSIVDIAAAAICLDQLNIDRVVVTGLTDGTGTVRCQHGILPIPVPAVTQIAVSYQLPMHIVPVRGELVTPTGAAIAAAIRTEDHLPQQFVIRKAGMGAGKRTYPGTSGFLRAMIIDAIQ